MEAIATEVATEVSTSTSTTTDLDTEVTVNPLDATEAVYWGSARITAYCPCEKCCGQWALNRPVDENGKPIVTGASGERLVNQYSCASSLPFGTKVYLPELDMTFEVQDRAADWIDDKYSGMYIDIYLEDHDECWSFLSNSSAYMDAFIVHNRE